MARFGMLMAVSAVFALAAVVDSKTPSMKDTVAAEMEHNHGMGEDAFTGDAFFKTHDFDNDGVLDEAEVRALYDSMSEAMGLPAGMDASVILQSVWAHVDADGDKRITMEEYRAAMNNPPDLDDVAGVLKNANSDEDVVTY